MKLFSKYIVSVIVVSIASYFLQVAWVMLVEPIMESHGVMFQGILPDGQIISGVAIMLINIVGAVILGVLFKGGIPIWLCFFYNVLYFILLLIYRPGRLNFSFSDNFFSIPPIFAFIIEVIPFAISRICVRSKK